jgi:DNA polymerase-3 subunit alpha
MENSNFVHLHVKSEYSLLESSAFVEEIINRAKVLGQKAVAITDKGVMYGAVPIYKAAKNAGIKPIIGMEISSKLFFDGLVLLAKTREGYKNLIKIASENVLTEDFLFTHSNGIIVLTGGNNSYIFKLLSDGFYNDAKKILLKIKANFEDVFIEIFNHNLLAEQSVFPLYKRLSEDTATPLAAANDVRMTAKAHYSKLKLLTSLDTSKSITENDEYYLKSTDEMAAIFPENRDAVSITEKIADIIDDDVIEIGKLHMPEFSRENVNDSEKFLRQLAYKGMQKRFGNSLREEHKKRLEYELDVILRMKFADYFLIVWDFVKYAKSVGIPVGPGRGSGAGSFAAYCIGIINIDPIKHDLLFERFLNPERVTLPDFDVDFGHERRHEIFEYAVRKYGEKNVAGIVTFMRIQGKSAVRSAAKLLNFPVMLADVTAKRIPEGRGLDVLKKEDGSWDETDARTIKLLDTAKLLEGYPKNISTHASGIVLSDAPIKEYAPTLVMNGMEITQFTMNHLEDVGLVKIDILGSKYLTIIDNCIKQIQKNDPDFSESKIDYHDKKTYELYSAGKTLGVFQFEKEGVANVMIRLSPETLEDLIAVNALYRPGPMDSIPGYIEARHGRVKRRLLHPLIDEILDETYGFIVYQEQVMQIVQKLAGFSLGKADILRRAMAKKKSDIMENERAEFLLGADKNAVPRDVSELIFDEMAKFSSYAFNKSHATAFAYTSFVTAFLKCHYPAEYMSALISASFEQKYINECYRLGLHFSPPCINSSDEKCTAENKNTIRFGLALVKGMGEHPIGKIMAERKKERFYSLEDFCGRFDSFDVPRNAIENLIYAGAFDFTKRTRREMLRDLPIVMETARSEREKSVSGQLGLFDFDDNDFNETKATQKALKEFDISELRSNEIRVCGLSFS